MAANPSSVRIFASFVDGSSNAADKLFHRYLNRLCHLARKKLAPRLARRVDPEDIVMSAYRSFFVAADAGRFLVERSGDLWALLTTITLRKLYRTAAHHAAAKRDVTAETEPVEDFDLNQWAVSREPAPDEAAAVCDEVEALLRSLSPRDRRILELRLQGEQIEDIAQETGASERTVRRALTSVREQVARDNPLPELPAREEVGSVPDSDTLRAEVLQTRMMSSVLGQTATVPFDRILLQRLIGNGGMGKVYEAVDRDSGHQRAVKFLHKSFQQDQFMVQRFLDEAATVMRLNHPGIIKTHGLGQTSAGVYFIVMDLIDGDGLDEVAGTASVDDIIRWIVQLALALDHVHQAGVVHCDLKPANVMITRSGCPVVTDFGLAHVLDQQAGHRRSMAGTAPWMAPEQVDSAFGEITAQTDVYGLGALLYTLLTGMPPFAGRRASDILSRVISAEQPRRPSEFRELPAALEQVCLQCLAKQQGERPASASALAALLT